MRGGNFGFHPSLYLAIVGEDIGDKGVDSVGPRI